MVEDVEYTLQVRSATFSLERQAHYLGVVKAWPATEIGSRQARIFYISLRHKSHER
jgi:hypothetical protein